MEKAKVPDNVEHNSVQMCPPGGIGNSRSSSSPFVSQRLVEYESKTVERVTRRATEVNGYSGMHEVTVSERTLAFIHAASTNSSRGSSSPLRLQDRRVLREEWIRENSPCASEVDDQRRYAMTAEPATIPRNQDRRVSQARIEMPQLLAHVKVAERASNFNLTEDNNTPRNSSARDEMPSLLAHVKVSERASIYVQDEKENNIHRSGIPKSEISERAFLAQKAPERSYSLGDVGTTENVSIWSELSSDQHKAQKRNRATMGGMQLERGNRPDYCSSPMVYHENPRMSSISRIEMPSLLAHVKVSERASNFMKVSPDNDKKLERYASKTETSQSFQVLQNKFGPTNRRASTGTFTATIGQNHMCLLCDKVVHNMEIVMSDGGVWHKSCFTCGALSDLGCKRVLITPISPDYFHHFGCPFCHGCTNKIFMHGGLHLFPTISDKEHSSRPAERSAAIGDAEKNVPEENSKAKIAYRKRVRAGISDPNSPIGVQIREIETNFSPESDGFTETLSPICSLRFHDIYDEEEFVSESRRNVLGPVKTDLDQFPYTENPKAGTNNMLSHVYLRLQKLEEIRIKEEKEAREEYFHRFDITVESDCQLDKFEKLRKIEEEKIEMRVKKEKDEKRKEITERLEREEKERKLDEIYLTASKKRVRGGDVRIYGGREGNGDGDGDGESEVKKPNFVLNLSNMVGFTMDEINKEMNEGIIECDNFRLISEQSCVEVLSPVHTPESVKKGSEKIPIFLGSQNVPLPPKTPESFGRKECSYNSDNNCEYEVEKEVEILTEHSPASENKSKMTYLEIDENERIISAEVSPLTVRNSPLKTETIPRISISRENSEIIVTEIYEEYTEIIDIEIPVTTVSHSQVEEKENEKKEISEVQNICDKKEMKLLSSQLEFEENEISREEKIGKKAISVNRNIEEKSEMNVVLNSERVQSQSQQEMKRKKLRNTEKRPSDISLPSSNSSFAQNLSNLIPSANTTESKKRGSAIKNFLNSVSIRLGISPLKPLTSENLSILNHTENGIENSNCEISAESVNKNLFDSIYDNSIDGNENEEDEDSEDGWLDKESERCSENEDKNEKNEVEWNSELELEEEEENDEELFWSTKNEEDLDETVKSRSGGRFISWRNTGCDDDDEEDENENDETLNENENEITPNDENKENEEMGSSESESKFVNTFNGKWKEYKTVNDGNLSECKTVNNSNMSECKTEDSFLDDTEESKIEREDMKLKNAENKPNFEYFPSMTSSPFFHPSSPLSYGKRSVEISAAQSRDISPLKNIPHTTSFPHITTVDSVQNTITTSSLPRPPLPPLSPYSSTPKKTVPQTLKPSSTTPHTTPATPPKPTTITTIITSPVPKVTPAPVSGLSTPAPFALFISQNPPLCASPCQPLGTVTLTPKPVSLPPSTLPPAPTPINSLPTHTTPHTPVPTLKAPVTPPTLVPTITPPHTVSTAHTPIPTPITVPTITPSAPQSVPLPLITRGSRKVLLFSTFPGEIIDTIQCRTKKPSPLSTPIPITEDAATHTITHTAQQSSAPTPKTPTITPSPTPVVVKIATALIECDDDAPHTASSIPATSTAPPSYPLKSEKLAVTEITAAVPTPISVPIITPPEIATVVLNNTPVPLATTPTLPTPITLPVPTPAPILSTLTISTASPITTTLPIPPTPAPITLPVPTPLAVPVPTLNPTPTAPLPRFSLSSSTSHTEIPSETESETASSPLEIPTFSPLGLPPQRRFDAVIVLYSLPVPTPLTVPSTPPLPTISSTPPVPTPVTVPVLTAAIVTTPPIISTLPVPAPPSVPSTLPLPPPLNPHSTTTTTPLYVQSKEETSVLNTETIDTETSLSNSTLESDPTPLPHTVPSTPSITLKPVPTPTPVPTPGNTPFSLFIVQNPPSPSTPYTSPTLPSTARQIIFSGNNTEKPLPTPTPLLTVKTTPTPVPTPISVPIITPSETATVVKNNTPAPITLPVPTPSTPVSALTIPPTPISVTPSVPTPTPTPTPVSAVDTTPTPTTPIILPLTPTSLLTVPSHPSTLSLSITSLPTQSEGPLPTNETQTPTQCRSSTPILKEPINAVLTPGSGTVIPTPISPVVPAFANFIIKNPPSPAQSFIAPPISTPSPESTPISGIQIPPTTLLSPAPVRASTPHSSPPSVPFSGPGPVPTPVTPSDAPPVTAFPPAPQTLLTTLFPSIAHTQDSELTISPTQTRPQSVILSVVKNTETPPDITQSTLLVPVTPIQSGPKSPNITPKSGSFALFIAKNPASPPTNPSPVPQPVCALLSVPTPISVPKPQNDPISPPKIPTTLLTPTPSLVPPTPTLFPTPNPHPTPIMETETPPVKCPVPTPITPTSYSPISAITPETPSLPLSALPLSSPQLSSYTLSSVPISPFTPCSPHAASPFSPLTRPEITSYSLTPPLFPGFSPLSVSTPHTILLSSPEGISKYATFIKESSPRSPSIEKFSEHSSEHSHPMQPPPECLTSSQLFEDSFIVEKFEKSNPSNKSFPLNDTHVIISESPIYNITDNNNKTEISQKYLDNVVGEKIEKNEQKRVTSLNFGKKLGIADSKVFRSVSVDMKKFRDETDLPFFYRIKHKKNEKKEVVKGKEKEKSGIAGNSFFSKFRRSQSSEINNGKENNGKNKNENYQDLFFVKKSGDDEENDSEDSDSSESTKCFSNLTLRRESNKNERLKKEKEEERLKKMVIIKPEIKRPQSEKIVENPIFSEKFYYGENDNIDDGGEESFGENIATIADSDEQREQLQIQWERQQKKEISKRKDNGKIENDKSVMSESTVENTDLENTNTSLFTKNIKRNSFTLFQKKIKTEKSEEIDSEKEWKMNSSFGSSAPQMTPARPFSGFFKSTKTSPLSPDHTLENGKIKLNFFEKPFDENGIIHYVSTEGMRKEYVNTHTTGVITAYSSSVRSGSVDAIVEQISPNLLLQTENIPESWVMVDFGEGRSVVPNRYCVRHGGTNRQNILRNWDLLARNNDTEKWTLLRTHKKDKKLSSSRTGTTSWKLNPEKSVLEIFRGKNNIWKDKNGFRFFKLLQTDKNASGNHCLLIGGMEIFGTLTESYDCKNGFLRNIGQFGLDSLFPQNKNNHNQNNRKNNGNDEDGDDDDSDESVISYSNPSVLGYDFSDGLSEYSTTSSNWNSSANVPKNVPGTLNFPLGYSATHRINILPQKNGNGAGTGNNSCGMSQISETENNGKETEENYENYDEDDFNDENKNENRQMKNENVELQMNKNEKNGNKTNKSFGKIPNFSRFINTEKSPNSKKNKRSLSPNISPLSAKNLEIHRKEYTITK